MNILIQREDLKGKLPFEIIGSQKAHFPREDFLGSFSPPSKKGQEMMRKGEKYYEIDPVSGRIQREVKDDPDNIFELGKWENRQEKMKSEVEGQRVYVKLLKEGPKTQ